ncbi:MAG: hypothetical protein K2W93_12610, partial [Burkholderiaceae bacterium]|nr:hypothetical protein [Burkholderiaceae bacterium]
GVLSVNENEAPLLSDRNGLVTLSFIPGQRSSPTDQVKIYACYGYNDNLGKTTDKDANGVSTPCANGQKSFAISPVSLTVVESPISISIGSDDVLAEGDTKLTYVAKFTVLVVDAVGNPQSDVQIAPVVDLLGYAKGQYYYNETLKKWLLTPDPTKPDIFLRCPNEDKLGPDGTRNGTIESDGIITEDINGSGQLDPRKSDVSIGMVGSTKTDKNGLATLRIEYPKSIAGWVRYMVKVSAPGVLSPPAWFGRYEQRWLPTLLTAIKSEATPAFQQSPYGIDVTGYLDPSSTTDNVIAVSGCRTVK